MSETISYCYHSPSQLFHHNHQDELLLAAYNEIQKGNSPCFFRGMLTDPFITARCLITLSQVVQSNFKPGAALLQRDPIVTSGSNKIRFEGFSQCAGLYVRLDILPEGIEGEFTAYGTTNVDFNPPMIAALSRVRRDSIISLSVGSREVSMQHKADTIVEKKVSLPAKWLRALTAVQVYLSRSELVWSLTRMQANQLFRLIPPGKPHDDHYISLWNNRPALSAIGVAPSVRIGGIYRLRLLDSLIPFAEDLQLYSTPDGQATTIQLNFGRQRLSLCLSGDAWRGFSGEGVALESLIEQVPEEWIQQFDRFSFANQEFNPVLAALDHHLPLNRIDGLAASLSAIGLLGFDLNENHFFYRRLPFKLSRLYTLHPRLKKARQLLTEGKVTITYDDGHRVVALVAGTGVNHHVLLNGEIEKCTCAWYSKHQGKRGICKHLIAVKKKIKE